MDTSDFPAISDLMPHRGPIVLLDRVVAHDGKSTTAAVCIEKQRWLRRGDGSVASWLAVEYMAQCIAAHEGLIALAENRPPPQGFLMAASNLRLEVSHFEAEQELQVRVERASGRPGLGVIAHQCSLTSENGTRPLAEGRLSVSVPRP